MQQNRRKTMRTCVTSRNVKVMNKKAMELTWLAPQQLRQIYKIDNYAYKISLSKVQLCNLTKSEVVKQKIVTGIQQDLLTCPYI